jgi:hypothetical protein
MKLLALLLTASLGVGLAGCGGGSGGTRSASHTITIVEPILRVSRALGPIDADDYAVLDFGHPASAAERGNILALVRRYYEVAVAENGPKACSMLYPSAAKEVVEEDGRLPGLTGNTCAVVIAKLFKQRHRQIVADLHSLKAVRVRIEGFDGYVVLRFAPAIASRELDMHLVGRAWRVQRALDIPMR